jgi:hypothetical protein
MTKREKEILWSICEDLRNGDEDVDVLMRLFSEVKEMIGFK